MTTINGGLDVGDVTGFASDADILNALNVACWGDSLTLGTAGSPSYPGALANLSGYQAYNGGVTSETSTQIMTRMLADTAKLGYCVAIWAGRNNYSDPTTVKADIAAMVAALGHDRYVVLSIVNGDYTTEWAGGADYAAIVSLNADLAAIYGAHYLDVRSYLVSLYNPSIPQDVIDFGHDVPPSSLRHDALHYNTAGYAAVANYIFAHVSTLQGSTGKLIAANNAITLWNFWRTIPSFLAAIVCNAGATFAGSILAAVNGVAKFTAQGTTGAYHIVTVPLGQQQGFAFQQTGIGNVWSFYQNASSSADLALRAYDNSGNQIDVPVTFVRAAGNPIGLGRAVRLPAGTTANAPLKVPHGVAPATPVDGDIWTTTVGLFVRINGATVGPLT